MKFGGSSLASAERFRTVKRIVESHLSLKPILVLSAMGDTTDHLLAAGDEALKNGKSDITPIRELYMRTASELSLTAEENEPLLRELEKLLAGIVLLRELSPRVKDYLVSFGERLTVRLFAEYLSKSGLPSRAIDAWELGIITTSDFTRAKVLDETEENLASYARTQLVNASFIPVVTGFIAKDRHGEITTLGRGGSDLTATLIAAGMNAKEVIFWKDVNGILTGNPQHIKNAVPVKTLIYEEAAEIAHLGAQILHPVSIQPVMKKKIPVRVKNSYQPEAEGTVISDRSVLNENKTKVIALKSGMTLVDIESSFMLGQSGFLSHVFDWFRDHKISVDMIATSDISISLTLDQHNSRIEELESYLKERAKVSIKKNKSVLSLVGKLHYSSDVLAKTFDVFQREKVHVEMISYGDSNVNLSFVVDDADAHRAYQKLHNSFFIENNA